MYAKFDWFFGDTTGIYDDTRKLMLTDPQAFMLSLLAIDEERHRHDIRLLELNMRTQEKKTRQLKKRRKGVAFPPISDVVNGITKKPVDSKVTYDASEDIMMLATLRAELLDIQETRKNIRKERIRPVIVTSQPKPKQIVQKKQRRRHMFPLFRHI